MIAHLIEYRKLYYAGFCLIAACFCLYGAWQAHKAYKRIERIAAESNARHSVPERLHCYVCNRDWVRMPGEPFKHECQAYARGKK